MPKKIPYSDLNINPATITFTNIEYACRELSGGDLAILMRLAKYVSSGNNVIRKRYSGKFEPAQLQTIASNLNLKYPYATKVFGRFIKLGIVAKIKEYKLYPNKKRTNKYAYMVNPFIYFRPNGLDDTVSDFTYNYFKDSAAAQGYEEYVQPTPKSWEDWEPYFAMYI